MALKFRTLNADEIDCRVSQITEKGLSLLLYKDARVDQILLDETVGPLNWQRSHELIGDRLYCTVSVWDQEKAEWISKQDVGTESNTEPEKGQASDSFKRACFNFGIGRELYTAPFIWISQDKCTIKAGKTGKPVCYDRFEVLHIAYQNGKITELAIGNKTRNETVFTMGVNVAKEEPKKAPVQSRKAPRTEKPAETADVPPMTQEAAQALWTRLTAANVNIDRLLKQFKVKSLICLTPQQVAKIDKQLEAYWNDHNRNPEPDNSGYGYVGSGFAEAV